MFSPLELYPASRARKCKPWPGSGALQVAKATNRRLASCGHLICRPPLLFLWALLLIIILYSSSSSDTSSRPEKTQQQQQQVGPIAFDKSQPLIRRRSSDATTDLERQRTTQGWPQAEIESDNVIATTRAASPQLQKASGKKLLASEYSRQSKVFILIVQDEDFQKQTSKLLHQRATTNKHSVPWNQSSSSEQLSLQPIDDTSRHRTAVPLHISQIIEILDSHRIGYTLDSTRYGLPRQLLNDQNRRQYSVIIIDNFLSYLKLSRWARDQLDRHCRSNNIGVVAYMLESGKPNGQHFAPPDYGHILGAHRRTRSSPTSTTQVLADEFPISFRPINHQCHNLSSPNCLVDYQLNDRAPILRMIKRRPNFVIPGELDANVNQSPWFVLSTNHVTYEPLTWAKLREPSSPGIVRHRRSSGQMDGTREANRVGGVAGARNKRGAIPIKAGEYADIDQIGESSAYEEPSAALSARLDSNEQFAFSAPLWQETSSMSGLFQDDVREEATERQVLSMYDRGLYDGIKRVIFGFANSHWLNRMLLIDSIEHLSSGAIISPLERFVQIDIDDIFVGETGIRMNASDVGALIEKQAEFAQMIEGGFKFNLGFSGKYFKRGNEAEQAGDELLIESAGNFTWFCHFWSHSKAHLINSSEGIEGELERNLEFAREKRLPIIGWQLEDLDRPGGRPPPTYAVAPHHSGVYPIHEQLYSAWSQLLNVQVTSTEEYPHLRPASGRRAFVHNSIKVLPRQTCGLYTHTIYWDKYPGGPGKLLQSVDGGDLFQTLLHQPVSIYMSHMSNYANDRLAPHTFERLFRFVQTNTNLQLKYAPSAGSGQAHRRRLGPAELADYYFGLNPEEREPLWTNPCADKRHLAIWAPDKVRRLCPLLPSLLIVGPQKTGTTALLTFLNMNELHFRSSQSSPDDYEEVQFFNDKHYAKGLDWYLGRFEGSEGGAPDGATRSVVYIDKSATYFDDPKAPRRAGALMPEARIVILLIDPADRAHSWYQHQRAHKDPAATQLSFEQVIMLPPVQALADDLSGAGLESDGRLAALNLTGAELRAARALRSRCLQPGHYARHLLNWLDHFPARQIIIIDGQWFKYNPAAVMDRLHLLLRLPRPLDYRKRLVYSPQKGFHCPVEAGDDDDEDGAGGKRRRRLKCLGPSKGRKYGEMSQTARDYLRRHFRPHNKQLARLLTEIGQPLPQWLDEALNVMSGAG